MPALGHTAACVLVLAISLACTISVQGTAQVPTQVIIQFTAQPAALNLPARMRRTGAANQRVAGIAAAAAAASAQQASFLSAAGGIAFRQDYAYKHVRDCFSSMVHLNCH